MIILDEFGNTNKIWDWWKMKQLIIAGTYQEAKDYVEKLEHIDWWSYLKDVQQILTIDMRLWEIHWVGAYSERKDYKNIIKLLATKRYRTEHIDEFVKNEYYRLFNAG